MTATASIGVADLLAGARERLAEAEGVYGQGVHVWAAFRAADAMFAAARAALLALGAAGSVDQAGLTIAFGREAVGAGVADPALHAALIDAVKLRSMIDAGPYRLVGPAEARAHLDAARAVLDLAAGLHDTRSAEGGRG